MKKSNDLLHCISSFEGTSYKNLYDTATISLFLDVSSADIIFHKFLALHSTLTGKKIFVTNLPF